MAQIHFFDDPSELGKPRDDVRINQIGLFVYPDGRRVAVGFDLTPFRERPCIEVVVRNARGETAGTLTVIESLQPNFSLTMHLRDREPTARYDVEVVLYYTAPGKPRQVVDRTTAQFDRPQAGGEEE
jgi:hypothetical protein